MLAVLPAGADVILIYIHGVNLYLAEITHAGCTAWGQHRASAAYCGGGSRAQAEYCCSQSLDFQPILLNSQGVGC